MEIDELFTRLNRILKSAVVKGITAAESGMPLHSSLVGADIRINRDRYELDGLPEPTVENLCARAAETYDRYIQNHFSLNSFRRPQQFLYKFIPSDIVFSVFDQAVRLGDFGVVKYKRNQFVISLSTCDDTKVIIQSGQYYLGYFNNDLCLMIDTRHEVTPVVDFSTQKLVKLDRSKKS